MIGFKQLRSKLNESLGIAERFKYLDNEIVITEDLNCVINGIKSLIHFESVEAAREYAIKQIDSADLTEVFIVNESKIAELLKKHDLVEKVTDTHIKSYVSFLENKTFTLDPVILEIKKNTSELSNKYEFILDDDTRVAIDEETINRLREDKYMMVEYMRESKENFLQIIKEAQ